MSRYFQIGESLFLPHINEVHHAGKILKIRPKTANLFTVLLNANGNIVSKDDLLNSVWNDVVVEEHVVFQSITELRKIFNGEPIIKTHPRKGYSIAADIKVHHEKQSEILPEIHIENKKANAFKFKFFLLIAVCLLSITTWFYIKPSFKQDKQNFSNGSILILPVQNRIASSEHFWIRYGGMDLLIKSLQPQISAPVLPAEMVLDVLKRAEVDLRDIDETAINRLFEVTGSEVIVTQTVSGLSGDYQLVYSIYKKQDVERGVIFAEDTETLFSDINSQLLGSLGLTEKDDTVQYQHSFTNALMAAAIDKVQTEDYQQAVTMFKAVLVNEPRNLLAVKMLVKSMIFISQYHEAESVAEQAIKQTLKNPDQKQLGRLMFWQAVSMTQQHKYEQALSLLAKAKEKSGQTNDVLYLANISRIKGKLYFLQNKYPQAREEIAQGLTQYQNIKEPYGQSSMYIYLGEIELADKNLELANQAFKRALTLAEKSRLTELINQAKQWLEKTE